MDRVGGPRREVGQLERSAGALEPPLARLEDIDFGGGATDIYKAYDSVVRGLVYHALDTAGFPKGLASAYQRFMEALTFANKLSLGIGRWMRRRRSIPQGCPFSMTILALLLRPWILQARALGTVPRVLAVETEAAPAERAARLLRQHARALGALEGHFAVKLASRSKIFH